MITRYFRAICGRRTTSEVDNEDGDNDDEEKDDDDDDDDNDPLQLQNVNLRALTRGCNL